MWAPKYRVSLIHGEMPGKTPVFSCGRILPDVNSSGWKTGNRMPGRRYAGGTGIGLFTGYQNAVEHMQTKREKFSPQKSQWNNMKNNFSITGIFTIEQKIYELGKGEKGNG